MSKFIDITGQTFGALKAEKFIGGEYGEWECTCLLCGKKYITRGKYLRNGYKTMCIDCQKSGKIIEGYTFEKQEYSKIKYNMQGMQIGSIYVVKYANNSSWECKCKCGKTIYVKGFNLRNAIDNKIDYMCADCKALNRLDNLTGQTFGNWYVRRYLGNQMYECECCCDKHTIRSVSGKSLKNGTSKSCGCKTRELILNTKYKNIGDITINVKEIRTDEQILASSSPEQLKSFIIRKFNKFPTIRELSKQLGIGECMTARKIKKYQLEEYINYETNQSGEENNIYEYIKSIYSGNILKNNRDVLNGTELDIYIPEKHLAIEYNGTYWHSDIYKDKMYHQDKTIKCIQNGIQLIHIFEYEWLDTSKQDIIKQILKDKLCKTRVYYARQLQVRNVEIDEQRKFLNKYHIQGYTHSSVSIGLYNDNDLIYIMTFGIPRFNKEEDTELIRMCTKAGTSVVGGAEKLLKHYIDNYKPKSILSYCNIAKFDGNSYMRIGFKTSKELLTKPNYVWVEPYKNIVLTRYQTQKQKLINNGLGTEEQTEDEIMKNLGYLKIYDSGNLKFILCNNNNS